MDKKKVSFFISQDAIKALNVRMAITGRKKSQLVERAILRCYGNGAKS
jgi:hypothetical protein